MEHIPKQQPEAGDGIQKPEQEDIIQATLVGEEIPEETKEKVDTLEQQPEAVPLPEKKVYKAAVIDAQELADAQARDIADHRMTESKEDRSKNWVSRTVKRIWKHNLAQEYYRQKEINKARAEILSTNNLFSGEKKPELAHKHAMDAIIDRFTSEYDQEVLRDTEREQKNNVDSKTNEKIKTLIREYAANPAMNDDAFVESQHRIISEVDKTYAESGKLYANNLLDIAHEVRSAIAHGQKIETFDFDVELTLGRARQALNTEAKMHTFDRIVEKAQNSKLGRFLVNEPVAVGVASGIYAATKALGVGALKSKVGQWATFGATAAIAGGVTAAKESARLERERAQHNREHAKGMNFEGPRREQIAIGQYETKSARSILDALDAGIKKVSSEHFSEQDVVETIQVLVDTEARMSLGNKRQIDLVSYSDTTRVEQEFSELMLLKAKLKTILRGTSENNTTNTFDTKLKELVEKHTKDVLEQGEQGVEAKDRCFQKMKRKKVAGAFIKTTLTAATLGVVAQETGALFTKTDGVIEGGIKNIKRYFGGTTDTVASKTTALEALRRSISGDTAYLDINNGTEVLVDKTHLELPEGVRIDQNPDGTFVVLRDDEVLVDRVPMTFTEQGDFSVETKMYLAKEGIHSNFALIKNEIAGTVSADDYIQQHPELTTRVHREVWYDNDTPQPFDKNELKLRWGGVAGTGVDEHGNYVYNMNHMVKDGSYHKGLSVDAMAKAKQGTLKALFSLSENTQHQVFEVPIDEHGNAVISKESPIAKILFEQKDGYAVFKGKFAEIAEVTSSSGDGQHVRILATDVGSGIESVSQPEQPVSHIRMNVPAALVYEVPPVVPVVPRTPLERAIPLSKKQRGNKSNTVQPQKPSEDSNKTGTTQEVAEVQEQQSEHIAPNQATLKIEQEPVKKKEVKSIDSIVQTYLFNQENPEELARMEYAYKKNALVRKDYQRYAKEFTEIKKEGREQDLHDAVALLKQYEKEHIAILFPGAEHSEDTSWAYWDMLRMSTNAKEDIFDYEQSKDAKHALQQVADRHIGELMQRVVTNNIAHQELLSTLKKTTVAQKEQYKQIDILLGKKDITPLELATLGKLLRLQKEVKAMSFSKKRTIEQKHTGDNIIRIDNTVSEKKPSMILKKQLEPTISLIKEKFKKRNIEIIFDPVFKVSKPALLEDPLFGKFYLDGKLGYTVYNHTKDIEARGAFLAQLDKRKKKSLIQISDLLEKIHTTKEINAGEDSKLGLLIRENLTIPFETQQDQ